MKLNLVLLLSAFIAAQDELPPTAGALDYDFTDSQVLNEWKNQTQAYVDSLQSDSNASRSSDLSSQRSASSKKKGFGISNVFAPFVANVKRKATCAATNVAFKALHAILQLKSTEGLVLEGAKAACKVAGLGSNLCDKFVETQGRNYLNVIRDMDFSKSYAAPLLSYALVRTCPHPELPETPISLPSPKPVSYSPPSNRTMRILHLTDFHFDPEYVEGAEAACKHPMCCQRFSSVDQPNPNVITKPASKWGDYKCDMPKVTLESMLNYIKQLHRANPFEIVLFTGDVNSHDEWSETVTKSKSTVSQGFQMLKNYLNFPELKFYPTVGNHDGVPANLFPLAGQPENNKFFVYPFLADQWKSWLPSKAFNQVSSDGYYSVQHSKNLKVIVLNNNLCYTYNMYLFLQPEVNDPNGMFKWLLSELRDAEKTGSKVYIASHIPPADGDCFQKFSVTWNKIVKAYSHLIVGQFYGHTHLDQFEIYYKGGVKTKENAINYSFVAPGITTLPKANPGFRVYEVDGNNYQVKDFTQYFADLNEQSSWRNGPEWKKLYRAKEAYKVPSSKGDYINAGFWHEVTELIERDPSAFNKHWKLKWKNSRVEPKCDETCKNNAICNLRASNSGEICSSKITFLD